MEFKKLKLQQLLVEDRIIALPDALCCHILSLIETKYAVRTSVLSTRWKNIWASVPSLHFSKPSYLYLSKSKQNKNESRFSTFVNRVLLFRNSLDIQKFRLECYCRNENSADIDTWIRTAIRLNVVELDLSISNFFHSRDFELPKCLFTCKTLVILRLYSNSLTYHLPKSGRFPSLKFLDVTITNLTECGMLDNLFSQCPILEHLIIDLQHCRAPKDLSISAPELKSLKISLSGNWGLCNIFVKSPKLENLDLTDLSEIVSLKLGETLTHYYLDNPKSLVKADIHLKGLESEIRSFESEKRAFVDRANVLLAEISGVQHLSLSASCLEGCDLPAFGNLKKLKLYDWELLAVFLKVSPNLEDLVLEVGTKSDEESIEHQWNIPDSVPVCLSSHLKTISIMEFKGREIEMEAAQYLLKNGRALKKMTIYTGRDLPYIEENKLLKKFLMFQKTCQVEFIKM